MSNNPVQTKPQYTRDQYITTIAFIDAFVVLHPRYDPNKRIHINFGVYAYLVSEAEKRQLNLQDLVLPPEDYRSHSKKLGEYRRIIRREEGHTTKLLERSKDETIKANTDLYKVKKKEFEKYLAANRETASNEKSLSANLPDVERPNEIPVIHAPALKTSNSVYTTREWGCTEYSSAKAYDRSGQARIFLLQSSSHHSILKLYDDKEDFQRELEVLRKLPTTSPFLLVPQNILIIKNDELEGVFGIRANELKNYTSEGVCGFESKLAPETLSRLLEVGNEEFFCSQIDRENFSIGEITSMILRNKFNTLNIQFKGRVWRAILRSAAEGIVRMHRNNIVHLDIKPANIVVNVRADEIASMTREQFNKYFGNKRAVPDAFAALIDFGSAIEIGLKSPDGVSYTPWYSHPDMDELEVTDPYYDWYSFAIVVVEVIVLKKRMDSIFTTFKDDGVEAYQKSKENIKCFPQDVRSRLKTSPYPYIIDWACKVFAREGDPKNYGEEFIRLMDRDWYMVGDV